MADPLFEEAYEFLGEDGGPSDEWTPGRAAFRPKGLGKKDGFRMVPISEPNDVTVAAMAEVEAGAR